MSISAMLYLTAALALQADGGLRLHNPHDVAVAATVRCATTARVLQIEPHGVVDIADAQQCSAIESALPLTVIEASDHDTQRILDTDANCGDATMFAPLFACKSGTGSVAVPVVQGATYSWSAEGAAIVGGAGTPRVSLAFGETVNVKLTCVITTAECTRVASAVIAVRAPIAIETFNVPQIANGDEQVTVTWSYIGPSPTSQLLTGDALESPVALNGSARSYTFTAKHAGSRNVELRASYFASMTSVAKKRRRSAGRSSVAASDCTATSATRKIEVKGCNTFEPVIALPGWVDAGTTFESVVVLEQGEEAQWTVENGTVVDTHAHGARATIRAGDTGDVRVAVNVARGACTRATSGSTRIVPAAVQCGVSPTATLELVRKTCDAVTVKATFTGAPPFRGTWFDGTAINTNSSTIEQTFATTGTYTIHGFRDATCIGVVSGAPHVQRLRPSVKLENVGGWCTTGQVVAKFEGTPPFSFSWYRSKGPLVPVVTNEMQVVRQPERDEWGDWRIYDLRDATTCSGSSNELLVSQAPHVRVEPGPYCQIAALPTPTIYGQFDGNTRPPYSVTWNDGVVTTSNSSSFSRTVPQPTQALKEYRIVSASSNTFPGGTCAAEITNAVATVTYRPAPAMQDTVDWRLYCPGQIGTATLTIPPPPEATITWTVTGGTILSGQGTPTITFTGGPSVTVGEVRVSAVYPDGFCSGQDLRHVWFWGVTEVSELKVVPATIRPGETAKVSFKTSDHVDNIFLRTNPTSRLSELSALACPPGYCESNFRDRTGPGTVAIEVVYTGQCTPLKSVVTTLTIQE